ncbi:tRNA uridine(34) 5-carboxymethylaminomethyl modification radical SAM/GNAT enzyme Elp3 [Candidatus Dojkabacteria bacterium]|nr:tRNA uridine(34) 5-carboxymethylaminomethyl modification radical SAM/GNAT enzyme Elp3 [Candidatus Dojkabacteria bacterium]
MVFNFFTVWIFILMGKQYSFNYTKYRKKLIQILKEIDKENNLNWKKFRKILAKHPKDGNKLFSKNHLVIAYRNLKKEGELSFLKDRDLLPKIRMKPVRTQSGVAVVTVLTKPYPCPGKCIFCPFEKGMPKSYLSEEPGAQRASRLKFDPYLQTYKRLQALKNIGHNVGKVELIILGGTWSSYPKNYQIWFVKRCFEALNDFPNSSKDLAVESKESKKIEWSDLFLEHKKNETAGSRCVGLVIETRPDFISKQSIVHLRKLGCTKIQLGFQSADNEILKKNKRGHDVEKTKEAFRLLRISGFKIHGHWMANLYGSDVEKDIEDFKKIFSSKHFRPDELKIYPCSLIEGTELMDYYQKGKWKPYTYKQLLEVLTNVIKFTPRYCRLTRVFRDIPSQYIVDGNTLSNFRQIAEKRIKKEKGVIKEIRSREIKDMKIDTSKLKIKITKYLVSGGNEEFIEYVTKGDRIAGFLRLFLPNSSKHEFLPELNNTAIIREVHVYGKAVNVGKEIKGKAQHKGLGSDLIDKAREISKEENFEKLAVISAVGTRKYYQKKNFQQGDLYQFIKLTV